MPDSNSEDGMSNVGDEMPIDSPPMQPEEPVGGGGGAREQLRIVYQGNSYTVSPDRVESVLSYLRNLVPSNMVSMFERDPVNQQGADVPPVQEKRKENFPEDADLGTPRKKGKFADDGEGSSSGSAQTACMQCGMSSTSTMMRSGPNGPVTLCNACALLWDSV